VNDSKAPPIDAGLRAVQRERAFVWGVMGLTGALFFAYALMSLPRLTNVHFGDVEFTGWSAPFGSRILRGERPYVDFVLPIPPGSFVLLALIEKIVGRPLLLEELWLNATLHLLMGVVAYHIARPFTSRKISALTAIATFVMIIQLNKECAYDHTAQLTAWAGIAAGISALLCDDPRGRERRWLLTGALSSFTLVFKQSTGVGITFGWLLAILYLLGVELWSGQRERARSLGIPLARYAQGVGLGIGGVWLVLLLLGSTARAYFQANFTDGSIVKGGPSLLIKNLTVFLFDFPAYPASLAIIAAWVLVGIRLGRQRGGFHFGDELSRVSPFRALHATVVAVLVAATFGSAMWFLRKPPYPITWVPDIDRLKWAPTFGLVPAVMLFVVHFVPTRPRAPDESMRADPERAGHALNAAMLAAFVSTLMHNTSAPEFRPYYDNNPIIPLTFMVMFVVLDRAKLEWLGALFLVMVLGSLFGNKYYRTMRAMTKVENGTYWEGMRTGGGGPEIVRAAARVREVTQPGDTVLVLPEDVELVALIGRPRPPLIGAIVFVDQYAPRLGGDDIARLNENLPKVIVIHPRRTTSWQGFFRIWSGKSGAEAVIQHVLSVLLPKHYKRDSSFGTTFLYEPAALDVYVRMEDGDRPNEVNQDPEGESSKEPQQTNDAPEVVE
jgi:hypothetical protein